MSSPTDPAVKKLDIKKYPNRRYYDATHSQHLTLDEIRNLIQKGYDLKVTDAKSGKDITAQVLTQIILELDTPKLDSLPVPLLVRLIRVNDELVKDFIDKYFNQALSSFMDYQRQLEEQIRRTHGLPSTFPSVSAWTKAMFQPFTSALGTTGAPAAATPGGPAVSSSEEELQQRVRDLEQQLARAASTKGPAPARRRRAARK